MFLVCISFLGSMWVRGLGHQVLGFGLGYPWPWVPSPCWHRCDFCHLSQGASLLSVLCHTTSRGRRFACNVFQAGGSSHQSMPISWMYIAHRTIPALDRQTDRQTDTNAIIISRFYLYSNNSLRNSAIVWLSTNSSIHRSNRNIIHITIT